MHAAARAKTPGTRRSKPAAADPWQALPRLADLFDSQTPQPFFKGSKVSALEASALTETKLFEHTAASWASPWLSSSRPGRSSTPNASFSTTTNTPPPRAAILSLLSCVPAQASPAWPTPESKLPIKPWPTPRSPSPRPSSPPEPSPDTPPPCDGSRSITPNYWCPSPTRLPLLPLPSLPPLPSSPLNQNPHLKPSYRNSRTQLKRSGPPLKLPPTSCCQKRCVTL